MKPAQQDWVIALPIMQQSVLFAAIRAPDGLSKNHPVKVLMRWYRRCVLLSAFDGRAYTDPYSPGGGSFTGPFNFNHVEDIFGISPLLLPNVEQGLSLSHYFDQMRKRYLEYVDEMPHHFQLHLMHAAQIIGVHHSDLHIRHWWKEFYLMIVNDAHLHPETDEEMNTRLSDNEGNWRAREEVTAK